MGLVLHRLLVGASRAATRRPLLTPLLSSSLLFCFFHPSLSPLPPSPRLTQDGRHPGLPCRTPCEEALPTQLRPHVCLLFCIAWPGLPVRLCGKGGCFPFFYLSHGPILCVEKASLLLDKVRLLVTYWPAILGLSQSDTHLICCLGGPTPPSFGAKPWRPSEGWRLRDRAYL